MSNAYDLVQAAKNLRTARQCYIRYTNGGGPRDARAAESFARTAAGHARCANDPRLAEFAERCADVAEGAG